MSSSSLLSVVRASGKEMRSDEERESYDLIVSYREHTLLEDEEEENEEEEDEHAVEIERKKRRKIQSQATLPFPPLFEPPSRLNRPEHSPYITLPTELAQDPSPISLFRLFFSDESLDEIALHTNLYAATKKTGVSGRPWTNISREELLTWIAITIYLGLYKVTPVEQCWSQQTFEPTLAISKYMPLIRYEQIKQFLYISGPTKEAQSLTDKLEPLLSHIQATSKKLYVPGSNVSVNEMTVRFTGRSTNTCHNEDKFTLEGFKILSVCESGYTYTFLPTSRVVPCNIPKLTNLTQTGSYVDHLVQQLPHDRHSYNIFMDEFFTSVKLFQHFRDQGIGACGATRNIEGVSTEFQVDRNSKLEWGTRSGVVQGSVLSVFWQDIRPVKMLTTIHGMVGEEWEVTRMRRRPRETSANGAKVREIFGSSSRKELKILKVIDDYNFNMGGVDVANQLRSYYNTQQASRQTWMPIFFWLLDTSIINSHAISQKTGSTLSHREFRDQLIRQLINCIHHTARPQSLAIKNSLRPRITKNFKLPDTRFSNTPHIVQWKEKRSTCVLCAWKSAQGIIQMDNSSPFQSQLWCKECMVPLCANKSRNCFDGYHNPE